MYEGKYKSAVKQSKKRIRVLLISLVTLALVSIGGTLAYLMTATGSVTNTFTPAKVEITIQEVKTDTTKSDIQFTNPDTDDAAPVYIRATLVIYWTDVIDDKEQVIAPPAGSSVTGGEAKADWTQVGEIYYYNKVVQPGETTTIMAEPIIVAVPKGSTAKCMIEVKAEAIQAEGLGATSAQDAWAKAAAN